MKKQTEKGTMEAVTREALNEAIAQYRRADVERLLKKDVLSQFEADEKKEIYKKLAGLRSMEILDILSRQEGCFPPEMMELDFSVTENRNFVREAMEKYKKKFDLSDEKECEKLFTIACASGSKWMVKTLINQKKAEGCYVKLGAAAFEAFEEIPLLLKAGFDDRDVLVEIYYASFLTGDSKNRIDYLKNHNVDLFVKNSAGKSAADLLEERIRTFKYGGSRSEKYSKLREEQALSYLRKLENPSEETAWFQSLSKRNAIILGVCAAAIILCIVLVLYTAFGNNGTDTETVSEVESETTLSEETESETEALEETESETIASEETESETTASEETESETAASEETESETAVTDEAESETAE